MLKHKLSRTWFYFRAGYGFYFVFLISGMNALMIAYFVVLGSVDCIAGQSLDSTGKYICAIRFIFPTFGHFVLGMAAIGTPSLIIAGYLHYKKHQYGTHAHVNWSSNPYQKTTLLLFLELLQEIKRTTLEGERLKRLEEIENKLVDFLEDEKLKDRPEDEMFKNF